MANEPKVRTKTKISRGGERVKTKTITEGPGYRKVEKQKTEKVPGMGTYSKTKTTMRGPEYRGVDVKKTLNLPGTKEVMTRSKSKDMASGEKMKSRSMRSTFNEEPATYRMGRKLVSTPAYTGSVSSTMTKSKGKMGKEKTKTETTSGLYDMYGKKQATRTISKTKKSK